MKNLALLAALALVAGAVFAQQPVDSTVLLRAYESLLDGDELRVGDSVEESFTVTVPADGTLRVTVVSPDFFPSVGVGTDAALLRRADGTANATAVSVRVESGQRIRIVVAVESLEPDDTFAEYLVSVEFTEGDDRLRVGSSTGGNLTTGDERDERGAYIDWHEIDLPAETRIQVDLSSFDFDAYLTVELPDGRVIENDDADGSDSRLAFSSGAGGIARIGATSFSSGSTGHYTIEARAVELRSIGVGELLTGELGGPEIAYVLTATPGAIVQIEVRSQDFDTYLEVSDAYGTYLYNDDAESTSVSRVVYAVAPDGEADVVVSSLGDGSGSFTLEASPHTFDGPEIADGYRLSDGELVSAALRPSVGDATGPQGQRFTFEADSGERVEIILRSDDFDSYLEVIAPNGASTTDDDSAGGLDSKIIFTVDASGIHDVYARDLGGQSLGSYTLSFSRLDAGRLLLETRGELTHDDDADITGKFYDIHPFTVTEGRLVTIDVVSDDFDGYAIVRSESGQVLYRDDDSGGNANPRIVFTAERSETLELVVTTYSAETIGGYSVSIYE